MHALFQKASRRKFACGMCAECQKQVLIKFSLLMEAFDEDEIDIIDHALDGVSFVEVIEHAQDKVGEQAARRSETARLLDSIERIARDNGATP